MSIRRIGFNQVRRLPIAHLGGIPSYAEILIDDYGASEVWPLVNISSGTTITARVNSARNGTLSGWDLQNAAGPVTGTLAPYSDGANDYGNIYTSNGSTGLVDIWNTGIGSMFGWAKVQSSNVWTDGQNRIALLFLNATDWIFARKSNTNNSWRAWINGSSADITIDETFSSTDWFSYGISWDSGANEVKAFLNGSQIGSTQSGFGTIPAPASTTTLIGARTLTPTVVWHGWLAYKAVRFGSIWTPTNFSDMHTAAATAGPD